MSASTISSYISTQPVTVRRLLRQICETIRQAAPKAEEGISYGMPAFKLNGKPLAYFAAWKQHIGLYALPSATAAFKKELSKYKVSKGTVQLPLDQQLPLALIKQMVKHRMREILSKKK